MPICNEQLPLNKANILEDLAFGTPCGNGTQLPMGLGAIGNGKVIFKRKFRWTFEVEFCCDPGPPKVVAREFVKIGARPQIDFEEVEINYLNGKMWIPGKGTWQTMTVTYYDVAGATDNNVNTSTVLAWIATIYDFNDPVCLQMNSVPAQYEGIARLVLWDGCGNPLEGWILRHVWPQSVNWGDLDMSSSEECTVELTLRYSEVSYQNFCGPTATKCPCGPCPVATQ
jgi:hypothetical protein